MTLGLTEIQTADPLPMIHIMGGTQFIASQPFTVSVSGLIPSLSAAPVPCWYRKCQHQVMETQPVPEYPLQLGCQMLALQDPPLISPSFGHTATSVHVVLSVLLLLLLRSGT